MIKKLCNWLEDDSEIYEGIIIKAVSKSFVIMLGVSYILSKFNIKKQGDNNSKVRE